MLRLYHITVNFVLVKSRVGASTEVILFLSAKACFSASSCLALEDIQVISIL